MVHRSAMWKSQCWLLAEKPEPIAQDNLVDGIIQGIDISSRPEGIGVGECPRPGIAAGRNAKSQPEKRSENKLLDMVVLPSKSKGMAAKDDAAVILALLIVLEGLLGCQQVGADDHVVADADQQRLPARIQCCGSGRG